MMTTTLLVAVAVLGMVQAVRATERPGVEFPLWPEGAPLAKGQAPSDVPSLTPYYPEAGKATGASVVVCPGGGYGGLAGHEGDHYARWLNELGVTAFVLKYRLGSAGYRHPAMLLDVQRAIRTVRAHAADWGLDGKRIGVMGSSAGGHLASTVLTHYDAGNASAADPVERASCRPDLGILCYAVITLGEFTHVGSRNNLLGNPPPPDLVEQLSNEKHVTRETPPCFLWSTSDDGAVDVRNTLQFAAALRAQGVPFAVHIFPHGPHGLGLGTRDYLPDQRHPWVAECARWLKEQGFLDAKP